MTEEPVIIAMNVARYGALAGSRPGRQEAFRCQPIACRSQRELGSGDRDRQKQRCADHAGHRQ